MTKIGIILMFELVLIAHSVNAQDPEITREILPDIKRQGETGYLNCTVGSQQNYKVYWSHVENNNLIISSDNKIEIDANLNEVVNGYHKYYIERIIKGDLITYMLIIRRLISSDAGTYVCTINIKGGNSADNPTKIGKLIVLSAPVIISARTSHAIVATEGQAVKFECDAVGYPTPNISWVRVNGGALPKPINMVRYKSKVINVPSIRREDRGMYRCIADNNVSPPGMSEVTLLVNFKPHARAVQTSYGQAQNRMYDLVIECRIQGFPEPDLQWYKVGKQGFWSKIHTNDKNKIQVLLSHGGLLESAEFWFQLTIVNVQGGDYGDYICEGRNRLGSNHAKIKVFETADCQGGNCPWVNLKTQTGSGHVITGGYLLTIISIMMIIIA